MREILRYKDIVLYRTLAGLKSEARKNYLGYLWFLLEPMLSTGVLYFAMSHLSGGRGLPLVLSILVGMVAWQWFEGSVMLSAGSIAGKFHIHLQVPLPKFLFPLVDIATHTVRFAFAFSVVVVACLVFGPGPGLGLLWVPAVLAAQLLYVISLSLVVSVVVLLFPDLQFFIQTVFRLLFFLSGVFFTSDAVPESLKPLFYLNPMAVFIESYRDLILHAKPAPSFALFAGPGMVTVCLLLLGCIIHAHFDKRLLKLTNV